MTPAEQVGALLDAKADALIRRDAANLESLLHADFVYINARGMRFNKASYVETFCRSGKIVFRVQRFSELDVTPFAGFAVATMIVSDRFSAGGSNVEATYRSLCVFSDTTGHWQWVAGQTMAIE